MSERISWEKYALELAKVAALRSEDPYVKVGACVLRLDNSVAALGYNGAPAGIEIDWSNREQRLLRVLHAEVNCLRYIKPGECNLIAVTLLPCPECLKTIASYGIWTVIYGEEYDKGQFTHTLAKEFDIKLVKI